MERPNNSYNETGSGRSNNTQDIPQDRESAALVFFRTFILLTSFVGCILNGMVSIVMLKKSLRRQTFIICTISQTTIDFSACLLSLISNGLKLAFRDDPVWMAQKLELRRLLHRLFTSDNFLYVVLTISNGNLILIAIERYVKIVHSTFYRNHFSK